MDQASDSQQAMGDHPSIDWTSQLERWPCTDTSTKALQELPRVRELTLRPRRLDLTLKPKKNQEAAMGQIRGELALAACLRCAHQKGPFAECVVIKGRFAKSCCNCHYSSQGPLCSFRELVPTVSTPDGLNATSSTLDEQAKPTKMVISQTGSLVFLAGPQASQSHNSYVSTRLVSKKNGLRNPPTPSRGSASLSVNLTANEPLTCKRKQHEAKDTGPELEQSQPEQAADTVYQQSGETIECLREEVERLRREKFE